MNGFLALIVIVLMVMVVVSLVRGIVAFLHSTKLDIDRKPGDGPSEMQLKQNTMMFARIKYQALAVFVVALLLAFGRS